MLVNLHCRVVRPQGSRTGGRGAEFVFACLVNELRGPDGAKRVLRPTLHIGALQWKLLRHRQDRISEPGDEHFCAVWHGDKKRYGFAYSRTKDYDDESAVSEVAWTIWQEKAYYAVTLGAPSVFWRMRPWHPRNTLLDGAPSHVDPHGASSPVDPHGVPLPD